MTDAIDTLAENEYSLMEAISRSPSSTQRKLSQSTGMSLGMTNLLIRRLARKGYIKVSQLDWKRTQYLLTLKGALEKARKSYRYSLYTIRIFMQIRDNIRTALDREYRNGERDFTVVAQDELLDLVQEAVQELSLPDARFRFRGSLPEIRPEDRVVLTATLEERPARSPGRRFIALVDFENIDFRIPA